MKALNRDRIYFLLKDTHWTFIWWEIAEQTLDQFLHQRATTGSNLSCREGGLSEARLILRVHDVTDIIFDGYNSHSFFDTEVTGNTGHWYLYIPVSNRNYCVEFGLQKNAEFCPVIRSTTIGLHLDVLS